MSGVNAGPPWWPAKIGRPACEVFEIFVFGEVGLAAVDFAALFDGFGERQVFEGVEGVMVDEDRDRPLCGQQVPGVLDCPLEAFSPQGRIVR